MFTIRECVFVIIIPAIASIPYKSVIQTDIRYYNISGTKIYLDRHQRSLFTPFGPESTYQALNGIMCYVCPPGFYKKSDCVVNRTIAVCEPCPRGQYNSHYNIANKCAVCSTYCVDKNSDIVGTCNATSDIKCRCKEGHFYYSKAPGEWLCIPHNKCQPGTAVIVAGSPESDTECKPCESGTFSPTESYNATCLPCSICHHNTIVKTACSGKADVICIPIANDNIFHLVIPVVSTLVVVAVVVFFLLYLWQKGSLSVCVDVWHDKGVEEEVKVSVTSNESNDERYSANINNYCQVFTAIDNAVTDDNEDDGGAADCTQTCENKQWCDLFRRISVDITYEKWKDFMRTLYSHVYKTVEDVNNRIDEICIDYQHQGVKEQVYRCLCKWKTQVADDIGLENIIVGLLQNHMEALADRLKSSYPTLMRNSVKLIAPTLNVLNNEQTIN